MSNIEVNVPRILEYWMTDYPLDHIIVLSTGTNDEGMNARSSAIEGERN